LTPKLEPLERTYSGTLKLGAATTTYDATGQVTASSAWRHVSDEQLAAAAAAFQGEVLQVPCMWSSTKYKNRVSWQNQLYRRDVIACGGC
jgi:tRNA pseudouridine55 synthase